MKVSAFHLMPHRELPHDFEQRYESELANELGNLAQRSLSMVAKNLDGIVPTPGDFTADDTELLAAADGLLDRVRAEFDADWGAAFPGKCWLMTIEHLTPQSQIDRAVLPAGAANCHGHVGTVILLQGGEPSL